MIENLKSRVSLFKYLKLIKKIKKKVRLWVNKLRGNILNNFRKTSSKKQKSEDETKRLNMLKKMFNILVNSESCLILLSSLKIGQLFSRTSNFNKLLGGFVIILQCSNVQNLFVLLF